MVSEVISIRNLSKRYRIGTREKKADTFLRSVAQTITSPYRNFKRIKSLSNMREDNEGISWALQNVSFNVSEGEVLGIIGHNGAGKSTLLKILSGITDPSEGEAIIRGRVSALLEVGTGFHPELSGRENVYMNGTILGMTRREISRKFDEIVDFSGIKKYIDTPVKFYSTGMKVRLGFAVAAHLEPEILIIDEVLAVGDAEFQRRCLGKMQDVSSSGRTVLFVSHSMASVRALCTRGLLLKNGQVEYNGAIDDVVEKYLNLAQPASSSLVTAGFLDAPGNENIRIKSVDVRPLVGQEITYDSGVSINIEIFNTVANKDLDCTLKLITRDEIVVFVAGAFLSKNKDSAKGIYTLVFEIPPQLLNSGVYKFSLIFGEAQKYLLLKMDNIVSFEIQNSLTGRGFNHTTPIGIIRPLLHSTVKFEDVEFN